MRWVFARLGGQFKVKFLHIPIEISSSCPPKPNHTAPLHSRSAYAQPCTILVMNPDQSVLRAPRKEGKHVVFIKSYQMSFIAGPVNGRDHHHFYWSWIRSSQEPVLRFNSMKTTFLFPGEISQNLVLLMKIWFVKMKSYFYKFQ